MLLILFMTHYYQFKFCLGHLIQNYLQEILTMKSGAVQHSPPDKSQPEPGPWSPVWPNFLDTSFFWHGFSQCITCEYIVKLEKYRKSFDNRLRLLSNIIQKEKINIDMIWVGNYGSSFRYKKLQMSWLYTVVTMLNWLKYLVCYVAWSAKQWAPHYSCFDVCMVSNDWQSQNKVSYHWYTILLVIKATITFGLGTICEVHVFKILFLTQRILLTFL